MERRVCYFTILLLIVSASVARAQDSAPLPTAEALLKNVLAKYRSARTYCDSGTLTSGSTSADATPNSASFEIRFARPASLRFELLEPMRFGTLSARSVWWSDEN